MTLREDVSGELRPALEALRDVLADAVEAADPEKVAPLAKQLAEVLVRLSALPDVEKVSAVDEIAKRRAVRHKTPASDGAKGEVKRRGGSGGAGGKRRSGSGPVGS